MLTDCNNKIMLATIVLQGVLLSMYNLLSAEVQNQYNLEQSLYPDNLTLVTKLLQNYIKINEVLTFLKDSAEEVSFSQSEARKSENYIPTWYVESAIKRTLIKSQADD